MTQIKFMRGDMVQYTGTDPNLQGQWIVLARSIQDGESYQLAKPGAFGTVAFKTVPSGVDFELLEDNPNEDYQRALDPQFEIMSLYF